MVNRNETTKEGERDITRQDAAGINYFSDTLSSPRSKSRDSPRFDELIVSLASAHENARARQVNEWERMRRQTSLWQSRRSE